MRHSSYFLLLLTKMLTVKIPNEVMFEATFIQWLIPVLDFILVTIATETLSIQDYDIATMSRWHHNVTLCQWSVTIFFCFIFIYYHILWQQKCSTRTHLVQDCDIASTSRWYDTVILEFAVTSCMPYWCDMVAMLFRSFLTWFVTPVKYTYCLQMDISYYLSKEFWVEKFPSICH